MSDIIPDTLRTWPLKPKVIFEEDIGKKCRVSWIPDDDGQWILASGLTAPEGAYVDMGNNPPYKDYEEYKDVSPDGRRSLDKQQARLYFRINTKTNAPECRIILPDDFPFRPSLKGYKETSKSFDKNKRPVPEVLLLYALKTNSYCDRSRAINEFPLELYNDETYGEIFDRIERLAESNILFRDYAGKKIVIDAASEKGLSDWCHWDKVATAAAKEKSERIVETSMNPSFESLFIKSVREEAIKNDGLPAQIHVEKRWRKLGGGGDWKDTRNKLGFEWLPSERDQKDFRRRHKSG